MSFDFDSMLERHGKDAIAVDLIGRGGPDSPAPAAPRSGFDAIPMWVADMNFATAPAVTEAIKARADHPAFGYFMPSDDYYDAIIGWQSARNGVSGLARTHIGYENGVLGCLSSAIQALTEPGEGILLHSPTYIGFTHVLDDLGREAVLSPLCLDENNLWRMDYGDMDRKLREKHIRLAILCSPHNPCGRVWERWELEKAMDVFVKNDVTVISDEIWSDILLDGHRHIPTQSVSDQARQRTIAIYAPSKTFNLAGLIGSYHIVYDPHLRASLRRQGQLSHYNSMNVLSMHALIGAYSAEGREWVDALCETLSKNLRYAYEHIARLPGVSAARPEGTYMMLLHCEEYCRSRKTTMDELLKAGWDVGVGWQDGRPFHDPYGIRINFAVPFKKVVEALDRLEKYVFN